MENSLGITQEDLEAAPPQPGVVDAELLLTAMGGDSWLENAKKIANMTVFTPPLRAAAILMGVVPVMTELFIIHGVDSGEYTLDQAIVLLIRVAEDVVPMTDVSNMLGFLVMLGVLEVAVEGAPRGVVDMESMRIGPLHKVAATLMKPKFEDTLQRFAAALAEDESLFDQLGIVFPAQMKVPTKASEDPA